MFTALKQRYGAELMLCLMLPGGGLTSCCLTVWMTWLSCQTWRCLPACELVAGGFDHYAE